MHFVLLMLFTLICVARAITITFPQTLVATQNIPFSWTRDENDPQNFDLRKQKLDDPGGLTTLSTPIHVVANGSRTGNGTIYFNRAGLFRVVVFDARDANLKQLLLSQTVTVFVAPTSAGASIPLSTGSTGFSSGSNQSISQSTSQSISQNGGESGGSNISQSTKIPSTSSSNNKNVPLVVGFVLGSVGLIFLVAATLLWFRYRTRSQTMAFKRNMIRPYPRSPSSRSNMDHSMLENGDEDSSTQDLTFASPMSSRHASPLPPPPDIQSVASSGSFSITSPIVARQRDAARNKANDLSNFRLSMSTNSRSTSSAFRSATGTRSSITSFPVPALPSRTRTNRQKLIEEKIQLHQSKILLLHSQKPNMPPSEFAEELGSTEQRVERLKQIHESDWALELTDVAPEGLHD
ncbi:hypothetical protein WG66_000744 [Moniliophthora roreri]|uniref:Mid2 domain-containing protein n=1 Tax=Moniliophthora roreri TaxID=221103 RepID=A0A0W0GA94_MONRR|nr:hypothetical protein WG66_000744 [Moniliophthora roreri]